jgi:hypothetical protein
MIPVRGISNCQSFLVSAMIKNKRGIIARQSAKGTHYRQGDLSGVKAVRLGSDLATVDFGQIFWIDCKGEIMKKISCLFFILMLTCGCIKRVGTTGIEEFNKPESAIVFSEYQNNAFVQYFDPSNWSLLKSKSAKAVNFSHKSLDLRSSLVWDPKVENQENLEQYLSNIYAALQFKFKIIGNEKRVVNGIPVSYITFELTDTRNVEFISSIYISSGEKGTFVVNVKSTKSVYDQHIEEIENFLNGFSPRPGV